MWILIYSCVLTSFLRLQHQVLATAYIWFSTMHPMTKNCCFGVCCRLLNFVQSFFNHPMNPGNLAGLQSLRILNSHTIRSPRSHYLNLYSLSHNFRRTLKNNNKIGRRIIWNNFTTNIQNVIEMKHSVSTQKSLNKFQIKENLIAFVYYNNYFYFF